MGLLCSPVLLPDAALRPLTNLRSNLYKRPVMKLGRDATIVFPQGRCPPLSYWPPANVIVGSRAKVR